MLAAHRDQENRVLAHQAAGASKQQLQAKTPGARFPKTPLKIPLNDENVNKTLGGKSVLQTKNGAGKSNMVTPLEPRTGRAPLGNKTTNAKARTTQQGVKDIVREFEKTQTVKPTTAQKPRQMGPQIETAKLAIHSDANPLGCEEEDIEYAPPQTKDLPYESDVLPNGTMTFRGLKKENMFKGYYQYYYNPVDENGVSRKERELQEQQRRAFKKGDEKIRKDMQEFDWSVGDVPGSENVLNKKTAPAPRVAGDKKASTARPAPRQPSTLASREAASALSMASKSSTSAQAQGGNGNPVAAPKRRLLPLGGRNPAARPAPTRSSSTERATALAASRSTIGYSKGRTALTAMQPRGDTIKEQEESNAVPPLPRTFSRSVSTASSGSDVTITPARFARSQSPTAEEWKKLEFLSIFDTNEDDDDYLGVNADAYESEDEFQLSTNF
ncbi:hypothetical protein GQ53DRAFT_742527 [Thozetella sp. PMI_491]|nr:hypothetical protein GQ53DRAFT_742527 [Thozetella sp. PMI_491]